ncbi:hypothetical protein D8780_12470 [Notoacmeibacter ruber]|uniref:Uncharacterized protein n=1 Tax=Notoacmeibacter ruber TaxID=2670375 RepID=A0A3L7JH20_9HYPH|nr:hypothetical protein D8780_12470 [Notoacmeibacter ruber]
MGYGAPIHLTGRTRDLVIYQSRLSSAEKMLAAGDTASTLVIRDGGNINRHLTAGQTVELITKAMNWVEAVMKMSWDMKDGHGDFPYGIPPDYAERWP